MKTIKFDSPFSVVSAFPDGKRMKELKCNSKTEDKLHYQFRECVRNFLTQIDFGDATRVLSELVPDGVVRIIFDDDSVEDYELKR